jgi:hypothetical protein
MSAYTSGGAAVVGAVVAFLAVGCGGGGDDGRPAEAAVTLTACDPVAQTGCSAGKKCTWIDTGDAAGGALGCAPAGAVDDAAACTAGAPGVLTGYDDCKAGLVCRGGTCARVCDLATSAGCGSGTACQAYAGLFAQADASPTAGACDPTCNPLTQVRLSDGAPACGSANPDAPNLGCYGAPGRNGRTTTFFCAPAGDATYTHRVVARGPASGGAYLNGCAPGYLPLLAAQTGSSETVCVALCTPGATSIGSTADRQGVAPATCPAAGATAAEEECRFWWFLEDLESTPLSPWTNTLGFCFDPTRYTYDDDQIPETPAVATPSCATLPDTDQSWACQPLTTP